jgi:hypothetical protein
MSVEKFQDLIAGITGRIDGRPMDDALETFLNEEFPAGGEAFQAIAKACTDGVKEGWMCNYGEPPLRYGRVIKPNDAVHGFSVDVVEMGDLKGPHHSHPNGEIDMVMPIDDAAEFDGKGAGWKVYGPGTAHHPTVRGGRALVLYLLPDGAIKFTKA